MVFAFLQPDTARNVLLILLGVGYFGYHALRWWRRRPKKATKTRGEGEEKRPKEGAQPKGDAQIVDAACPPRRSRACEASGYTGACRVRKDGGNSTLTRQAPRLAPAAQFPSVGGCAASTEKTDLIPPTPSQPQPSTSTSSTSSAEGATGEALYLQARAIPHQEVPDFDSDGPYLKLLGDSSAQGYALASAKLGEYAMRRAAWVEAYYWMSMAKRQGMQGLANVMREIRKNWSMDDFPNQTSNVNWLFTIEAGSIGRALLHVDSGHEAAKAKEFLKANYPEFVT